ncbi:hypothetical protein [Oceanobacillus jeddahense]|uniref:hypothetical protein n=1 Tax=Oceanobacillus jeddahense TaxID=1462527 RepID=UPI0012ED6B48|nr:hypothetical protein [Oceanobacillus jeddahense]
MKFRFINYYNLPGSYSECRMYQIAYFLSGKMVLQYLAGKLFDKVIMKFMT